MLNAPFLMGIIAARLRRSGGTTPGGTVTWNPADTAPNMDLSNGNLTASNNTADFDGTRATVGKLFGKWYWEVTADSLANPGDLFLGVADMTSDLRLRVTSFSKRAVVRCNGSFYVPGGIISGMTLATGDIAMIAWDATADLIWFGKNGAWYGGGDPAAGTGAHGSGFALSSVMAAFAGCDNDLSPVVTITANFGDTAFAHTQPTGFKAYKEAPGDQYFNDVVLLLHFEGSDGSTTFVDSSSVGRSPVQIANDAQIDTSEFVFGTSSLALDGGADAIRYADDTDFGFGTGDFTIEFQAKINPSGNQTVLSMLQSGRSNTIHLYTSSNSLVFYTNGGNVLTSGSITSAWHHFALSRVSGSTRLFVDGVQQGSTYADSNDYGSTQQLAIGDYNDPLSGGSTVAGHIDELRITKGVGRYAANFTPPATPFPDSE